MHSFFQDIRFASRMLVKNPGFTVIATVCLGLGVGANAAIFALINAVLLRPLPIHEPDRVVALYQTDEAGTDVSNSDYPSFAALRERCGAFAGLCARDEPTPVHLGTDDVAMRLMGGIVSGDYFAMLGVKPAIGRLLTAEDDVTIGGHPVAVLSHDCWENRFGGDPGIVGRNVNINGYPFQVVGVVEPGFGGTTLYSPVELWATMAMQAQMNPQTADEQVLLSRRTRWMDVIGRLAPGVSIEQARAEADSVLIQYEREHTDAMAGVRAKLFPIREAMFWPEARAEVLDFSQLLLVTVGVVLLIACANVANLLLARAGGRRREIAVRLAIGAGRSRLVRQLLTESVLLALLGGLLGLVLSIWLGDLLLMLVEDNGAFDVAALSLVPDGRVLAFTFGLAALTGVIFGLVPALQASRPDLVPALRNESTVIGRSRRFSLQSALVIGQVALSLVLLVGASLLVRSLTNAQRVELGFDPERVLAASMNVAMQGYDEASGADFQRRLLDRVRAAPGVERASLALTVPVSSGGRRGGTSVEGHEFEPGQRPQIDQNVVDPQYFETMGVPLLHGRAFDERDAAGGSPVVIISESMAGRFWPDGDAIGRTIRTGRNDETFTIVGVVGDCKYRNLRETGRLCTYFPIAQQYSPRINLVARTAGDPMAAATAIQAAVRGLDPGLPLYGLRTLKDQVAEALATERAAATLFGALGALALVLAAAGLYGVMSYVVGRRVREIGIRMALGADRRTVLGHFLGRGVMIASAGVSIGLVIALVATRVLEQLLFGLSPRDPATLAGVALLLGVIAVSACWLPARRATRINPMQALRCE